MAEFSEEIKKKSELQWVMATGNFEGNQGVANFWP